MDADTQNDLLDAEFRQILLIIKSHISHVNDHYHLDKYRVWLERLNGADASEKLERNNYLLALADQVREDALLPPFTSNPPKGPLPRLRTRRKDELNQIQWPYLSPRRSQPKNSSPQSIRSEESAPQRRKLIKTKTSQPFQKLGNQPPKSETSSWYDLSDSTSATHATDEEERRVLSSKHKRDDLKTKKHDDDNQGKTKRPSFDLQQFLAKESGTTLSPTQREVEALKQRMKDLLEVKNALRDTHCLTEGRKKTIEDLQMKLSHVEQQNAELQSLLETQQSKFLEMDKIKSKELNAFKDKCSQLRQKEVDYLKQFHRDEVNSIEKKHSSRMNEMQKFVESMKREYEDKIRRIADSNLGLLRQKESEIQELQSQLQVRDSQQMNEGNGEQINTLKRCISRLDRVLHKNEKDYLTKIEKLRQDLDVKDVTNKVKLQTQKADLLVRNSAAKQEELKNALNSLEAKYKKMMETLQTHALDSKRHDDKLIDELKNLLEKNKIMY